MAVDFAIQALKRAAIIGSVCILASCPAWGWVAADDATETASGVSGQPASSSPPGVTASPQPPPAVKISVDATGRLILQSDDPAALDRLEEIMRNNRPPRKAYDVFKVEHARASWVKLSLDEYFEDNDDNDDWRTRFFFGFDDNQKDDDRQLGSRPPLRFIADNDTNSIVVIGADDIHRQTIRELIELWDVPAPESDIDDARYTELVQVKFSRAESIAATLKEAYRDLLSANDKAFQGGEGEESKRESGSSGGDFSFAYKGKLSFGVDSITNSILVSAEGQQLLQIIVDMIELLDSRAKTENDLAVHRLPAGVNGESVKESLLRMFAAQKSKNDEEKKQQQQAEQQQQQMQQQQMQQQQAENASRERGRDRSRR